jgi:hypothetical protein
MQETRRKIRNVEEAPMRLIRQGDRFVVQFSFVWEVSTLAEREEGWVSLFLPGHLKEPLGAIHSHTHEVRLAEGVRLADRQIVVLGITQLSEPPQFSMPLLPTGGWLRKLNGS